MNECRAFIELRRYIEECVIGGTFLLKLNELHSLYVELLKNLGIRKTIKKTFQQFINPLVRTLCSYSKKV